MNRTRILSRAVFGLTAGLTLLALILRTVAFYTHYDRDIGYFDATLLPTLCRILCVLAVLCPAVMSCFIQRGALPTKLKGGRCDLIALFPLVGFLLFVCLTLATYNLLKDRLLGVLMLLALGGAAYALCVLLETRYTSLLALIGFLPIIWGVVTIARTYADPYITMNSPIKLSLQFGCLGLMLGLCGELRYRLDKPAPRLYLTVHAIGTFFCLFASVPYLIAYAGGVVNHALYPQWFVVLLCNGLYFLCRMIQFLFFPAPADMPADGTQDAPTEAVASADAEVELNADTEKAATPDATAEADDSVSPVQDPSPAKSPDAQN